MIKNTLRSSVRCFSVLSQLATERLAFFVDIPIKYRANVIQFYSVFAEYLRRKSFGEGS